MAGIWSINDIYNANSKKLTSKLSFDIGEIIAARIIKVDDNGTELLLRMLDGWQFPAELKLPLDHLPEGLIKFQVEGYEQGKLILKMINVPTNENKTDDSIMDILKEQNLSLKDDYTLLKEMVKHNIPLTRENISEIKTVNDFIQKIEKDSGEGDIFVSKYMQSKNISTESFEGKLVKEEMGKFFNEIKGITTDELLSMFENKIDVNTENIRSFKKIFLQQETIFNELKDMGYVLSKNNEVQLEDINIPMKEVETETPIFSTENIQEIKDYADVSKKVLLDPKNKDVIIEKFIAEKGIEAASEKSAEVKSKIENIINELETALKDVKEDLPNKNEIKTYSEVIKKIFLDPKNKDVIIEKLISEKEIEPKSEKAIEIKSQIEKIIKDEPSLSKGNQPGNSHNTDKIISEVVKEEIKQKVDLMKEIIKDVISKKAQGETEDFSKLIPLLKENINDFKVFNSVSNQYYYMDIPLKLREDQYQCKLIIKDDRQKGKKIDTQNVKLALSLNTKNLDIVDAYINIKNTVMNVDIKCNENYIKLISFGKEKIVKDLSALGYNVYVSVDKKVSEVNIVNCRDFFQDNSISSLDVKV